MGTALNVFSALSVSYLDRVAARDMTRASIVLSKLSQVWPDFRQGFAAEMGISVAGLPAAIPDIWDGSTREIVRIALPAGSESVRALVTQIAATTAVSALPDRAKAYLEFIPTSNPSRTFAARVAQADIAALPQTLDALIAGVVAGDAVAASVASSIPGPQSRFNVRTMQAFRVPQVQDTVRRALEAAGQGAAAAGMALTPSPTMLPETVVYGERRYLGIPIWGWAVGGALAVVAVGAGIYVYRKRSSP